MVFVGGHCPRNMFPLCSSLCDTIIDLPRGSAGFQFGSRRHNTDGLKWSPVSRIGIGFLCVLPIRISNVITGSQMWPNEIHRAAKAWSLHTQKPPVDHKSCCAIMKFNWQNHRTIGGGGRKSPNDLFPNFAMRIDNYLMHIQSE